MATAGIWTLDPVASSQEELSCHPSISWILALQYLSQFPSNRSSNQAFMTTMTPPTTTTTTTTTLTFNRSVGSNLGHWRFDRIPYFSTNEAPSDVNTSLDCATYPKWKMFHFASQKIFLRDQKHGRLSFGTSGAICNWWSLVVRKQKAHPAWSWSWRKGSICASHQVGLGSNHDFAKIFLFTV